MAHGEKELQESTLTEDFSLSSTKVVRRISATLTSYQLASRLDQAVEIWKEDRRYEAYHWIPWEIRSSYVEESVQGSSPRTRKSCGKSP